jgi:hypothetical protein
MVAYADIHALVTSPLRQKLHPGQFSDDKRNEFQEKTGIDVEHDVDHIVSAAAGGDDQRGMPLMLVRGRFDIVKIEGVLRDDGATVDTYRDIRLVLNPEKQMSVGFLEPGLIAVGSVDAVKRAIDTKAGGEPVSKNDEVMRLVRDVENSTAWAVARFDGTLPTGFVPNDIVKQLPAVNWLSISGNVDDGVRGTVRAEARDETAAKDLTDVVRGFMALARLQAGSHPEFSAVINSLQLSGHDKTVTLDFAVPAETINSLSAMHAVPRVPAPAAPRAPAPPAAPPI